MLNSIEIDYSTWATANQIFITMDVAVVRYKGVEVLIPPKEMMVHTGQVPSGPEYAVWLVQISRILNARLDTDIDFVVRGIDRGDRTVVGSRRDAMWRKRKRFYDLSTYFGLCIEELFDFKGSARK